jgi:hypothetical protein
LETINSEWSSGGSLKGKVLFTLFSLRIGDGKIQLYSKVIRFCAFSLSFGGDAPMETKVFEIQMKVL